MADGEPKEPGEIIPIERGFAKRKELEDLGSRLDAKIREIFEYHAEIGQRYESMSDSDEKDLLGIKLVHLQNKIEAGSRFLELIKSANTQEVEAYIAEDYKALK